MATVIVLPGLGHNGEQWKKLQVGHRKLKIINYEQLEVNDFTFKNLSNAVIQLVRDAEQPVVLVGEAFGSVLALDVAVTLFGKLDRLILVAPDYRYRRDLLGRGLFNHSVLNPNHRKSLANSMKGLDLTDQFMHIQGATFVYVGENDRKSRQPAEDISNRLLDGHLKVVPRMGHELNGEGLTAIGENLR